MIGVKGGVVNRSAVVPTAKAKCAARSRPQPDLKIVESARIDPFAN